MSVRTEEQTKAFLASCGIGLSKKDEILWLKNYIKAKPWASWAKRHLSEAQGK